MALSAIAALAAGSIAQSARGAAVRMWPKTVVDQDEIRVEDVAEVLGAVPDQAGRYAAVVIKSAPKPGQQAEVRLDELRQALVRAGANPVEFTVRGAVRCKVVRALTLRLTGSSHERPGSSRFWWPGRSSAHDETQPADRPPVIVPEEIAVPAPQPVEQAETLERALHEFIAAKTAYLGGKVHLRFSANVRDALSLARPEYDFRIHWRSERRLGSCGLEVDILKDGEVKRTVPMIVDVSVTLPVVVAARPINRGQVVRDQDVQLVDRDFFHLDRIGMTELARAVGQQARRLIRRGEIIRVRDLKTRPLVSRGDLVTVWSDVGGLRVKTAVKALGAGAFGETIEVRNEASREKFMVTVVGPQTARVAGAARQVSMAVPAEGGRR